MKIVTNSLDFYTLSSHSYGSNIQWIYLGKVISNFNIGYSTCYYSIVLILIFNPNEYITSISTNSYI